VNYNLRHRRELAQPPARWLASSDEGSVVLPLRLTESDSAGHKLTKQAKALLFKEEQASALDHQVDDVISRFILKS
jgi:hypothetical protein